MSDDKENSSGVKRWFEDNIVPLAVDTPSVGVEDESREDTNPGPADGLCPVCHHAMSRHTKETDPESGKVFLRCPGADTVIESEAQSEAETEAEAAEHEPGTQNGPVLD